MKRALNILMTLTLALGAGSLARAGEGDPSVTPAAYHGDNDLREAYEASQRMRMLSESTVALFSPRNLMLDEATGNYNLKKLNVKQKFNLRDGETFNDQPSGAFCSGVLVGEDLVLTAGHCLAPHPKGGPCGSVLFAFGFAYSRAGSAPVSIPAEDVYGCSEVVQQHVREQDKEGFGEHFTCRGGSCQKFAVNGKGADYALVRLNRPVKNRVPLAISRAAVRAGAKVGAIGYPSGMPVKVQEEGASVRSVNGNGYFVTDLDTFGGNSGSPVFNLDTYKIEGILVRGDPDYAYASNTSSGAVVNDPRSPYQYAPGRANYYAQDGGDGEEVTLIGEVQALIPVTRFEAALDQAARQVSRPLSSTPKAVPAIYSPGQGGSVQPAVYYAPEPSAPQPVRI